MRNATCSGSELTPYYGAAGLCGTAELWGLFGVTVLLLLASLLGNLVCCFRRLRRNAGVRFPQHARTSVKTSVETPLYGNLSFLQSGRLSDEKAGQLAMSGQPAAEPQKMCYANLKVTNPAAAQQAASAGIHYADVVTMVVGASETEPSIKDTWKKKRIARGVSRNADPLYASVQTDRYKTLFEDQGYANNN
ncbi:signaling threshold-regulating transmembrane adapter 1 [Ambystoma mexicanum]|uniref:signaling threshold-regulating transmembrane adapter 1 n=1 Tax=Ambystoma mexicanum TaxID=8296 RepID=UPI0037E806AD